MPNFPRSDSKTSKASKSIDTRCLKELFAFFKIDMNKLLVQIRKPSSMRRFTSVVLEEMDSSPDSLSFFWLKAPIHLTSFH